MLAETYYVQYGQGLTARLHYPFYLPFSGRTSAPRAPKGDLEAGVMWVRWLAAMAPRGDHEPPHRQRDWCGHPHQNITPRRRRPAEIVALIFCVNWVGLQKSLACVHANHSFVMV